MDIPVLNGMILQVVMTILGMSCEKLVPENRGHSFIFSGIFQFFLVFIFTGQQCGWSQRPVNCGQVLKLGDSNDLLNFLQVDMENGQQTAHYFASPDFTARAQIISGVVNTPSRTQTLIQTPRGI